MILRNFNSKIVPIIHCQGTEAGSFLSLVVDSNIHTKIDKPDDLTIITTFTEKEKSPVVSLLEYNNIQYINSYKDEYGSFKMTNKVKYIINALKSVATKYVLILDGYDVVFQTDLMNIIDEFKTYNTKILFNASRNNYPVCTIDKIPMRDYLGNWNNFNAGCAIGYTNELLSFYIDAYNFMQSENYINIYNSEQYILRHIFARYSQNILKENPYITIDYNCKIFLPMCNGCIKILDNDIKDYVVL